MPQALLSKRLFLLVAMLLMPNVAPPTLLSVTVRGELQTHAVRIPRLRREQLKPKLVASNRTTGLGGIRQSRVAQPVTVPPLPTADALTVTGPPQPGRSQARPRGRCLLGLGS